MNKAILATVALSLVAMSVIPMQQAAATGSSSQARVPRTGQTGIYDASGLNRDDGGLRKGVVWPVPRFRDTGRGTVRDKLTGLIWLKNGDCGGGTTSWQGALDWVAELNANGSMNSQQCGDVSKGTGASATHQTDWRLPNRNELASLLDLGQFDPSLPPSHPFVDFQSYLYWSSTSLSLLPDTIAWFVSFVDGYIANDFKSANFNVIVVRGGS